MRFRNDDFEGMEAVLRAAIERAAAGVARVALAVASPVGEGPIRLTNRDWTFDAASLRRATGVRQVRIVNDFAAAAAGLAALRPHESMALWSEPVPALAAADPPPDQDGSVRLVLGAGTGLGMAAALRGGPRWQVLPSEAGHAGCATTWPDALPALADARWRWGRASWERLLSGDGLARLDAGLHGAAARAPAAVAAAAQAGEPIAARAARAFSRLLGEFAGDACLMLRAEAVYLTGGVLDGLGDAFDAGAFRDGFEDKGRFAQHMREVPTRRVLAGDLALRGLACIVSDAACAPGTSDPR